MLSFGISNLNLGIFDLCWFSGRALSEILGSCYSKASSWDEADSDIDKLLLRCLELKDSAFVIFFQVPRLTSEIWKS